MSDQALGRRVPTDFAHVDKFAMRRRLGAAPDPFVAERTLPLPTQYRSWYDQGREGACVGFACSWQMSILNRQRYAAQWLYQEAQKIDEWTDTPPAEGTSVRAAFDVLRDVGHRRMWGPLMRPQFLEHGIASNWWARTVDELRESIDLRGVPVVLGVNWYDSFGTPELVNSEWWIGRGNIGRIRGGHAICAFKVSDRRQAIGLVNTWGAFQPNHPDPSKRGYPLVWIGYDLVERLIKEDGEAGLVVDRQ